MTKREAVISVAMDADNVLKTGKELVSLIKKETGVSVTENDVTKIAPRYLRVLAGSNQKVVVAANTVIRNIGVENGCALLRMIRK